MYLATRETLRETDYDEIHQLAQNGISVVQSVDDEEIWIRNPERNGKRTYDDV